MKYNDMFRTFMSPLLDQSFGEAVEITTSTNTYTVSGLPLLEEFGERRSDNVYEENTADYILRIRKIDIPNENIDSLRRSSFLFKSLNYTVIKIDDDDIYYRCYLKVQEVTDIRSRGRREY